MQNKDIVMLTALFIIAFFLWTLPIQKNPLPFGEGDGAWHFANGDFISTKDHSMGIMGLPNYISFWYYGFNKMLGPGALEYPPPNHVNYAIMQLFTGQRFVPVSIFKAVTSFIGVFGVYFLMRKLYGFVTASLAGFGMIFSLREYMIYLWGQQPSITAFVMVPLILYAVYAYFEKKKPSYLYMATLLLASQYLLHLQGLIVSVIILLIFLIFLLLKQKSEIIKAVKRDLKHIIICIVIFALISLPFILIYAGAMESVGQSPDLGLGRLLQWSIQPKMVEGGFPPDYVLFFSQYRWFFVPFILIGLLYLALKRDKKAFLMLSWFIAVYIVLHSDIFMGASSGRVARMLICGPSMVFSLTAIGVTSIPSFVKMPKNYRALSRYALAILFSVLIAFTLGKQAYSTLNNSYSGYYRTTQPQFQAAEWIREHLPENAALFTVGLPPDMPHGVISYPKMRWYLALSQRYFGSVSNDKTLPAFYEMVKGLDIEYYLMFDYTDMMALGLKDHMNALQAIELKNFENQSPVYDQNNIRVYKIEEGQNLK